MFVEDVPSSIHAIPATLANAASFTTAAIKNNQCHNLSLSFTSSVALSVSIQRYANKAGTIVAGDAATGASTAATPYTVTVLGEVPFKSYKITFTNGAGSSAAISNVVLQQSSM